MKTLYALLLMVMMPAMVWAQVCQPDTSIQANNGIFPDSANGIPVAYEGLLYQQTVTIIAPSDTQAVIIPGTPAQTVLIDSIVLDSVFTLPTWLSYDCEPADCSFIGGESGCITFYGTPPVGEAGKSYSLSFITRSHGRLALLPNTPLPAQVDTTFNYYTLFVINSTSVQEKEASATWQVYPNPARGGFFMERNQSDQAAVKIYSTTGALQYQSNLVQSKWINTSNWPAGIYWIQLNEKNKVSSQQIVIH